MLKLADNLSLPAEAVTQTFALLARRGAGKTHAASVLAEEMLSAGHCVVWLDPIGVAWGLRSHFPIAIFGGEHQDVPLEPSAGKIVAEFLVEKRISALLDFSSFGENEMRRFVGDFCQRFYERNRQPVHVFIDEADEFAPQSAAGGEIAKCLGAMQNLVRRGRARGIGVTLITQRSAVLSKSVLTQTECLIAMQTTAPHDLRAIEEWVKYHGTADECRDLINSLPKLQQGEAWVYSPGWLGRLVRVKFRHRKSFDSSRTPKPGKKTATPATLADVDLPALTKEIQSTIERAKADDPKELRRQITELRKQLAAKPTVADPATIERAVRREIGEERQRHVKELNERDGVISSLKSRMGKAESRAGELVSLLHVNGEATPSNISPRSSYKSPVSSNKSLNPMGKDNFSPPSRKRFTDNVNNCELGKCERAILQVLSQFPEGCNAGKLTLLAGYRLSGGFRNSLSALRSADLITGDNTGIMRITPAGETCGPFESLPSGTALVDYWLQHRSLGRCERSILAALLEHPDGLTAAEICAETGYELSGGFRNALSALRTAGLIEGRNTERMRPVETLVF